MKLITFQKMAIYNAHTKNMKFEDPIFSTSGITTERHTNVMPTNLDKNGYYYDNSLTNLDNIFDQSGLMDLEVIAIDPDCFYSSEENDDDEEDSDDAEDNEVEPMSIQQTKVIERERQESDTHVILSASQTTTATDTMLDINIHGLDVDAANFLIDDHEDDILFANNKDDATNFDLASYIAGDATSLLLSPPPAEPKKSMLVQKMQSPLKYSPVKRKLLENENNKKPIDSQNLRSSTKSLKSIDSRNLQSNSKSIAENPRNRKRKLVKSVAIIESDSSDSESNDEIEIDVEGDCDNDTDIHQWKKQRSIDDSWTDVTWSPMMINGKDGGKKTFNEQQQNIFSAESKIIKKNDGSLNTKQSKSLRQMIHKQMLSNRPVRSSTILKKYNVNKPVTIEESGSKHTNVPNRKPITGVGRGKDILITAKYYKSSSDNSDDSDASDQIVHTVDSEDSGISKSGESFNSQENIGKIVYKKPETFTKSQNVIRNGDVKINSGKVSRMSIKTEKNISSKSNESISPSVKCSQNKIKMSEPNNKHQIDIKAINNNIPPLVSSNKSMSVECKGQKLTNQSGLKSVNKINCVNDSIKSEMKPIHTKPEVKPIVPPPEMITDNDVPKPVKRKLNIQEYLKRRTLNQSKNENTTQLTHVADIKIEGTTEKLQNDTAPTADVKTEKNDEEDKSCGVSNEQSMYEEIIIVSMGCNTEISIPEIVKASTSGRSSPQIIINKASGKCAVLLSDIHDTLVKATVDNDLSKISSNSLISSIQNVILTKTTAVNKITEDKADNASKNESSNENSDGTDKSEEPEHGENKIIMHLRKDRIRQPTRNTSIQTEPYFQFPLLEKLAPISKVCQNNKEIVITKTNGITSLNGDAVKCMSKRGQSQNGVGRNGDIMSESSYYSDEDSRTQRRSRYSDYHSSSSRLSNCSSRKSFNLKRDSSRNGSGDCGRYSRYSRNRTMSRSSSKSSDASTSSSGSSRSSSSSSSASSSSSSSRSSSSDSMSSRSSCRSFNSYGDSSTTTNTVRSKQCRRRRSSHRYRRYSRNGSQSRRGRSPEVRRIVYVGRLEPEATKETLRKKFSIYGTIKNVSMHYKEGQWKYGFVTFINPKDAYTAIESGSKNPNFSDYDISFGGRREFCKQKYLDLDNTQNDYEYNNYKPPNKQNNDDDDDSFEALLRKMKERIQKPKN